MEETNREDIEKEERGVSFGEICHVIFRWNRLLVILAATLVAAIATALIFKLYINPRKTVYEAKFNFRIVNTASSSERFTSGQYFLDEETLNSVKNSDERFAGVDVGSLLPGGEYPITFTQEYVAEEGEVGKTYYVISVSEKPFANEKTAKDFVRALIDSVKEKSIGDAKALSATDEAGFNGYQTQLRAYSDAETYEEKLSILSAQRNYLLSFYDAWIAQYGGLYQVRSANQSLTGLRETVQLSFGDTKYNELAAELDANAYIPGGADNSILQSRLNTYNELLDLNKRKLENLKAELAALVSQYKDFDGASSSLMPQFGEFHSRIAALTEENAVLEKKIKMLTDLIGNEASIAEYLQHESDFNESLQNIYDSLTLRSQELASVAEEITTRESYTAIDSIEQTGGSYTLLVTVAVAVLAFLIASAVCYFVSVRRGGGALGVSEERDARREQGRGAPQIKNHRITFIPIAETAVGYFLWEIKPSTSKISRASLRRARLQAPRSARGSSADM